MNVTITAIKQDGVIKSEVQSGYNLTTNEGYGNDLPSSLKDLAFRMESEVIENGEEKYAHFIQTKQPIAFQLFVGLYDAMGGEWFELRHLMNKLNEPKAIVIMKLEFLIQFGYLTTDRLKGNGMKYKLTPSEEDRKTIFNDKIQALKKEIAKYEVHLKGVAVETSESAVIEK